GAVDNECVFDIDVCLLRSADPALPACTPDAVTAVAVQNPSGDADVTALGTALNGLLPHVADTCTVGQQLHVPLKGGPGHWRRGSKTVRLTATTASGTDGDHLKLTCVPRGWPSHGYDHANRRNNPSETTISPANAASLTVKWTVDLH